MAKRNKHNPDERAKHTAQNGPDQGERFAQFLGLWDEDDRRQFEEATRDLRCVDDED